MKSPWNKTTNYVSCRTTHHHTKLISMTLRCYLCALLRHWHVAIATDAFTLQSSCGRNPLKRSEEDRGRQRKIDPKSVSRIRNWETAPIIGFWAFLRGWPSVLGVSVSGVGSSDNFLVGRRLIGDRVGGAKLGLWRICPVGLPRLHAHSDQWLRRRCL